jgi:ribosomal-protein-alanine N-acetyltransferase
MRIPTTNLPGGVVMRPVTIDDAERYASAYYRNREHLRPWDPRRTDAFYTVDAQRERIAVMLDQLAQGRTAPWVLMDGTEWAGSITLNSIVLGPFRSASVGYWLDTGHLGRGLASAALDAVCRIADEQLGLHRLDASTLTTNVASQRVLTRQGFERYGLAPKYLHIDGAWRDHYLYQRILNDRNPG